MAEIKQRRACSAVKMGDKALKINKLSGDEPGHHLDE